MITAEDLKKALDALPIKKKATPVEMLLLILSIGVIFCSGIYAGIYGMNRVKIYFDARHNELLAAIAKVDADNSSKVATLGMAVGTLSTRVDKNEGSISGIRRYYWSNADMTRWANQLLRDNSKGVPEFIVPEVPPPTPPVATN